jgi:cytochrome c biogenesis protein CcdA
MGTRLPIAFLAGFASVITPCVLPLVPGYLSALSSVETGRLGERGTARQVVLASIPFILGFTVVFVVLGAGAAAIGGAVSPSAQAEVAGFVLVVLGLAFVGLLPVPERLLAPGLVMLDRLAGVVGPLQGQRGGRRRGRHAAQPRAPAELRPLRRRHSRLATGPTVLHRAGRAVHPPRASDVDLSLAA